MPSVKVGPPYNAQTPAWLESCDLGFLAAPQPQFPLKWEMLYRRTQKITEAGEALTPGVMAIMHVSLGTGY